MAIQINLDPKHNQFQLPFPEAYVRITNVHVDFASKQIHFQGGIWANKDSRDKNGTPVGGIPMLSIRAEAQEAQHQLAADPNNNNRPLKGADGKPVVIQTAPALPSFDEALALVQTAVKEGKDYRAVGYDLLKKLDLIKDSNPQDV